MKRHGGHLQLRVAHVDENDNVRFLGDLGQIRMIQPISQRNRRRLVHELEHIQAGYLSRVEQSASLRVCHVARHRHNAIAHFRVQIHLGDRFHFGQEHGRNLFARKRTCLVEIVDVYLQFAAASVLALANRRLTQAQRVKGFLVLHLRVVEFATEQALEARYCVRRVCDLLLLGRMTLIALVI